MKKLLVANWKMNVPNLKSWQNFRAPKNVEVVICPPFPYLRQVARDTRQGIKIGGQDVFWEDKGAFTGEVSSAMLKDLKAGYVIIGHSERRRWLGETDEMINKKVLAALRAGLKVILCVGEPLAVRRKGLSDAKRFIINQLRHDLLGLKKSKIVVAYEPIWAIGTGRADKPADTAEMARFIKEFLRSKFHILNSRVLYGGSVNSKNAEQFFKMDKIDGALVGGASLNSVEFAKILTKVKK